MAEAAFRPPRRKRRVFECYQAPFPVGAGGGDFRMCRADMVNNSVVVRSPEDVERLYNEVLPALPCGRPLLTSPSPFLGSCCVPVFLMRGHSVNTQVLLLPLLSEELSDEYLKLGEKTQHSLN